MKKVTSNLDILADFAPFKGKVVIDVGCGTGELVRGLASQGAKTIGLDAAHILAKARRNPRLAAETYRPGRAEQLPFGDRFADIITFFASLHHVPTPMMLQSLREARRVLKPGGRVVCVEPVGKPGSYFELIRLAADERDIQAAAYRAIQDAGAAGLTSEREYQVYFERSLQDFMALNDVFIQDANQRDRLNQRAHEITRTLSRDAEVRAEDFRYRSICRVNVLAPCRPLR